MESAIPSPPIIPVFIGRALVVGNQLICVLDVRRGDVDCEEYAGRALCGGRAELRMLHRQSIYSWRVANADAARVEWLERRWLMNGSPEAITVTVSNSPLQYVEKQGAVPIDPGLTLTDSASATIRDASVQIEDYAAAEDSLSMPAQDGISASWNSTSGVLSLMGDASVAAYQAALRAVTYADGSDDPTTAPRIAQVTVTDTLFATATAECSILITAVNDPPNVQTPPTQTTGSASSLVFFSTVGNPILISDVDANGAVEQVALTATDGILRLADTAGLTFLAGSNDGGATITMAGTLAAINSALDGLTFTPASQYASTASLEVSADDLGNSGIGGAQIVNAVIPIIVTGPTAPPPPSVGASIPAPTPIVGESAPPPASPPPSSPGVTPAPPAVAEQPITVHEELAVERAAALSEFNEQAFMSFTFSSAEAPALFADMPEVFTPVRAYSSGSQNMLASVRLQPNRDRPVNHLEWAIAGDIAQSLSASSTLQSTTWQLASHERSITNESAAEKFVFISRPDKPAKPTISPTSAAAFDASGMLRELDGLRHQIGSDIPMRIWAGSAALLSAGVSLAYFFWMARGGSLLSGLLSSLPAWKMIDPLPILEQVASSAAAMKRNEDGGLESVIKDLAGQ